MPAPARCRACSETVMGIGRRPRYHQGVAGAAHDGRAVGLTGPSTPFSKLIDPGLIPAEHACLVSESIDMRRPTSAYPSQTKSAWSDPPRSPPSECHTLWLSHCHAFTHIAGLVLKNAPTTAHIAISSGNEKLLGNAGSGLEPTEPAQHRCMVNRAATVSAQVPYSMHHPVAHACCLQTPACWHTARCMCSRWPATGPPRG